MDLLAITPLGHERHADPGHPERPARIDAVLLGLTSAGGGPPRASSTASDEALLRVHPASYLAALASACTRPGYVDADTYVTAFSAAAARASAGAAIDAVDAVVAGQAAFAVTRPPGHHALPERAMGFCLLANGAIAARHAQAVHGIAKVAVIDWDVHHGNGTQAVFWRDPSVLTVSLHEWPLWPYTGDPSERGEGPGRGTALNVPVPTGTGGEVYLDRFRSVVLPAVERFAPDLVIVACGFDGHRRDPLAGLRLEDGDFGELAGEVRDLCRRCAIFEPALVLEGGYDLDALRGSAAAIALAYG